MNVQQDSRCPFSLPSRTWLHVGVPAKTPVRLYIGEPIESPVGLGRCPLTHQGFWGPKQRSAKPQVKTTRNDCGVPHDNVAPCWYLALFKKSVGHALSHCPARGENNCSKESVKCTVKVLLVSCRKSSKIG